MRIFIGGAEDVGNEISSTVETLRTLTPILTGFMGEDLSVRNWREIPPANGLAQDIIFEESEFESASLFIFFFWHKFGTPVEIETEWRKEQHRSNPDRFPGVTALSGTEAEIEAALQYCKNYRISDKRIMIFKKSSPVAISDIDPEQLERLDYYFKERLNTAALYRVIDNKTVSSLGTEPLVDILRAISSMGKVSKRTEYSLHEFVSNIGRVDDINPAIVNVVERECSSALELVRNNINGNMQSCKIATPRLYDLITKSMEESELTRIIDQEIFRWSEILEINDNISTFNYSQKIINLARESAARDSKTRRLFVIDRSALADPGACDRILEILNRIKELTNNLRLSNHLETKVFIVDYDFMKQHTDFEDPTSLMEIRNRLKKVKDIVLCKIDDADILFREYIDYESRNPAFETQSEISLGATDIDEASGVFHDVWDKSFNLEIAISSLQEVPA